MMFPQAARKKYRRPCVSWISQCGRDMSKISFSPVTWLKSARVDHCTEKSKLLHGSYVKISNALLNFVVIAESCIVCSWRCISTVELAMMSTATMLGGSGGLDCAKPSTILRRTLALRPHATCCFSVSPPAHPVIVSDRTNTRRSYMREKMKGKEQRSRRKGNRQKMERSSEKIG